MIARINSWLAISCSIENPQVILDMNNNTNKAFFQLAAGKQKNPANNNPLNAKDQRYHTAVIQSRTKTPRKEKTATSKKGSGGGTATISTTTGIQNPFNRIKTEVVKNEYPSYLKRYEPYINEIVKDIMANNASFTNETIVTNAKIKQLDYLYQNEEWRTKLENSGNNAEQIKMLLMQNEIDVYPKDWEESKTHLDSYNKLEQLQPNCDDACSKCGMKKVFNYQLQVRGADEGTTTFFRCLNCGKKWAAN